MDRDELRESLETRARERAREVDAAAQTASASRRPPRPGDLYALEETADYGIEWLVLDRADVPSRVLLVPADTNPLAGSADVEIPSDHPLGPLTLRCSYGVWLDPDELDPDDRTGVLDDPTLEAALKKRWALARESLRGSPLEREVDVDAEYEDWVDEILIPARTALEKAHREIVEVRTEETSYAPLRLAWGLAAMLLFAVVGLSFWTVSLQEQAQVARRPEILVAGSQEIRLGGTSRGDVELERAEAGTSLVVDLSFRGKALEFSTFLLEIVSTDNEDRWTDTVSVPQGRKDVALRLPVDFLGSDRVAELRVWGIRAGEPKDLLFEGRLAIP